MHDWLPVPVSSCPASFESALEGLRKFALTVEELEAESAKVDPDPSEAQKESGVYRKGHVRWKGLPITIETAKGQYRSGVDKDGKAWKQQMTAAYGYFKRTLSESDSDHIDVFLSDKDLESEIVFVVNQVDPGTGRFDEHKVVAGTSSEADARACYLSNYEEGWKGLGSVAALTLSQLKDWLERGDTSKPLEDGALAAKAAAVEPRILLIKRADRKEDDPYTVAVDLDGTLAEAQDKFDPKTIGPVRERTREWVKRFHEAGARIIIFTVRGDNELIEKWLKDNDVPYHYVNENPSQPEGGSSKVIADCYFDDRAHNAEDPDEHGPESLRRILREDEDEPHQGVSVTISRTRLFVPPEALLEMLHDV